MNQGDTQSGSFLTDARDLFAQAIEIEESAERERFVEEACAGRSDLHAEVSALLRAFGNAGDFLDQTDRPPEFTVSPVIGEQPGSRIGPYTILRRLGEGGFGEVFLAEQSEPLRRTVALKVIKPGLDTREVIARFEAERQTLARMEHPQIAKIFDAGATERGRPFFVMEFVDGLPLTDYCDTHSLSIIKRLELFLSVCRAVQHAHQKGIIHRDLKPSNILVVEENGQAIAKVIDFGIAKATDRQLTDGSLATISGQMIGTPQYMSPEQADSGEVDIDTRSDIYSLGVILFELLVGTTPLQKERVRATPSSGLPQLIRSEEAARPSKRLDETGPAAETIVTRRGTEQSRLRSVLRRDLDWIVLKALEKERDRRYDTVDALARDLRRFLKEKPVEARPPSMSYRFRKLARRHQVALVTGGAFSLLVVAATIVSTLFAIRAYDAERLAKRRLADVEAANATAVTERDRARDAERHAIQEAANANAVANFVRFDLLAGAVPAAYSDMRLTIRGVLDRTVGRVAGRFDDQPQVEASLRTLIGNAYLRLGAFQQAETQLQVARDLETKRLGAGHVEVLEIQGSLAECFVKQARFREAEPLLTQTVARQQQLLGPHSSAVLRTRTTLATLYLHQRRFDKAAPLTRALRDHLRASAASLDRYTLMKLREVADLELRRSRFAEGELILNELGEALGNRFGADDPDSLAVASNLVTALGGQNKLSQALSVALDTLERQKRVLGEDHPDTIKCRSMLAVIYAKQQDYTRSDLHFEALIAASRRTVGRLHPAGISYQRIYASMLIGRGKFAEALPYALEASQAAQSVFGDAHPAALKCRLILARAQSGLGRRNDAEQTWKTLSEQAQQTLGPNHPLTRQVAVEWSRFRKQSRPSPRD